MYGAKSYVISFPQLGQIRLSEGGSYHNYGYARNGDDIYLGEGGAGQVFGELFVAAPLHQRVLLVMKAGECRAHAVLDAEHPEQGFESQGIVIDCDVSRSKSGFVVRFDAVVAAASRNTERLEFSQVGDAVISPAVRLGRLLPCLGACSVSQSAP